MANGWHQRFSVTARSESRAQLHFSIRLEGQRVVGFTYQLGDGTWTWRVEDYGPPAATLWPPPYVSPFGSKSAAFDDLEMVWSALMGGANPATLGIYEVVEQ